MGSAVVPDVVKLHTQLSQLKPQDPNDHPQLLKLSQALTAELDDPFKQGFDLMFSFAIVPALCIAADLNLFSFLQDGPKTADDLSRATSADKQLLVRILRVITSAGACKLVPPETYASTTVTHFFAIPSITDGIKHNFELGFRPCAKLPEFLRRTNFENPCDPLVTPFHDMCGSKLHWFEWIKSQPREWGNFNSFMTAFREAKGAWTEIFPAEEAVYEGLDESEKNAAVCVDVGGGHGQDLSLIQAKFHTKPTKLILQDTPEVIGNIPSDIKGTGIEANAHDFFGNQPVKGARIYILKHVLHDWPDPQATKILQNVALAMKNNYSKILILENIIPDGDVPLATAGLDTLLMAGLAAGERTDGQWRRVIEEAGLVFERCWKREDGDAMIECGLK